MTKKEPGGDDREYDALLRLEELESLLEELEEAGVRGELASALLPDDLRGRFKEIGIASTDELRAEIARIHAQLDREDTT